MGQIDLFEKDSYSIGMRDHILLQIISMKNNYFNLLFS